jgi:type I restriction enzyme M protein
MLDDIKKTLWATADKLRANMDAAEYKHLVLGLIFIKYISDTFTARSAELAARLRDPDDEYFYGDATALRHSVWKLHPQRETAALNG